jgi:transaldolase / glucose-6-phosphate isomerase
VLGMGGSSLCPDVLRRSFGRIAGHPELRVLDSTVPAQVRAVEDSVDLPRTLFVVASKSGGTLEPNIFKQYFFERVSQVVGAGRAGRQFVAITDPGSAMQKVAEADGFRRVLFGRPSIGGRYSALSDFGMAPAAIMGLDVGRLLARAQRMVERCGPDAPTAENPGVALGIALGVCARRGRDKVTLLASPPIDGLGAWLEQLLAESTGKQGRGLIPVDREPLAERHGADRVFVSTRLAAGADPGQDAAVDALERAGHPVIRIAVESAYDLGAEFFRWEIATAVAGAILGINPFDQPDVEGSKVATRRLTEAYERAGQLPPEAPILETGAMRFFADGANAAALAAAGAPSTADAMLRAHLHRLRPGDYAALLAYVEMTDAHEARLQAMRRRILDRFDVATALGFGPRFLHSTGQAYKGGPNTGVVLQVTSDDAVDLPVPGQRYTFGVVKAAQARGDLEVLAERGRRALRVHLGPDVAAGLDALAAAIDRALA